jgi:CRISPR-associated protein Csb3
MPNLEIPIDPINPAQFYACCGLVELFDLFGAETLSRFEVNRRMPRWGNFVLESAHPLNLNQLLGTLQTASYTVLDTTEEAIKPVLVGFSAHGKELELNWWLDEVREESADTKCWAGQVTSRKIFQELPKLLPSSATPGRLFSMPCSTSTRFGVDPRSAWNALDFGSSPNEQGKEAATFAAVEVLAAFGLQGFRPVVEARNEVAYHMWRIPLPRAVARVFAACGIEGIAGERAVFQIARRGQSYKYFTYAELMERNEQR